MKKVLALVFAVLIFAGLTACGKDYSKHQFDYLGEDFSWDMTVEDAVKYIEARQIVVKTGAEVDDLENWTVGHDRDYVFSFDENGKVEYVKCNMYGNRDKMRHFVDLYGEYDEYEDSYNAYIWYGTMAGRNTVMSFSTTADYDVWLQFKPA